MHFRRHLLLTVRIDTWMGCLHITAQCREVVLELSGLLTVYTYIKYQQTMYNLTIWYKFYADSPMLPQNLAITLRHSIDSGFVDQCRAK